MPKKSYNFYLSPEADCMIDSSLVASDSRSRSDFVEKAVRYYAASLGAEMHKELLSQELIRVLQDNIKNVENHISSTIFKMAGEQAVLSLLFADMLVENLDRKELQRYRNEAYDLIRKRHGSIMFEDALANCEGGDEYCRGS